MFQLFSFHWILCTAFNFLLSYNPHLTTPTSKKICDYLIVMICAVNIVILIEYARGLFIRGQNSSTLLTVLTLLLNAVGIMYWSCVVYLICLVLKEVQRTRERH